MISKARAARVDRARVRSLDESLLHAHVPALPSQGWIRTVREALGMTQKQLGMRLKMSPQGVSELERKEATGRVTLETLRRVADALDCDVRYTLAPTETLESTITRQATLKARRRISGVNASQALENAALTEEQVERTLRDLVAEMLIERPRDLWD